jgi:hypothetical protein
MANFDMSVPHQLTQEEALKRIQHALAEIKKEHGDKVSNLSEKWTGNTGEFSLTVMGFDIAGKLVVNASNVAIDAELPFAASLFKGKIKELIGGKAGELLKP